MYGTVTPGMLYDATTDRVMMDKILWHEMVLKVNNILFFLRLLYLLNPKYDLNHGLKIQLKAIHALETNEAGASRA